MNETAQWLLDRQMSGDDYYYSVNYTYHRAVIDKCVWLQKWDWQRNDGKESGHGYIRIDFSKADPKSLVIENDVSKLVMQIGPAVAAVTYKNAPYHPAYWVLQRVEFSRVQAAVLRMTQLCGSRQPF